VTPDDIRSCFLGALKRVSLYGFHPHGSGNTAAGYSLTSALDYHYLTMDPPRGTWTSCVFYLEHLLGTEDLWYWQETQGHVENVTEALLHGAERAEEVFAMVAKVRAA
jgi:hypothetical protein